MSSSSTARNLTASCLAAVSALIGTVQAEPGGTAEIGAMEAYANDYLGMAAFDGVILVMKGDDIVYEKAFGKADYEQDVAMQTDTVFRIASLSKDITTAAIGRLHDRGLVALDVPVSTYLPTFPHGEVTIDQLLRHRAGIAHTNRLDWLDMTAAMPLAEIVDRLGQEPLDFEPGARSSYSNGGYAVLAAIIEAVSGVSYERFIETEFSAYASIGHEAPYEVVDGMAERYAPGPVYGERARATTYLVSNRVGGGSLHANASDLARIFRAAYYGDLVSAETRERLFPTPESLTLVTGRSPGTLAQLSLDPDTDLMLISLSSNTAWPGSFNRDLFRLYKGEAVSLSDVSVVPMEPEDSVLMGEYTNERFGWTVSIEEGSENLVFIQDDLRSALAPTATGEYHLPVYDWLCAYAGDALTCRQRDEEADIRFVFTRNGE